MLFEMGDLPSVTILLMVHFLLCSGTLVMLSSYHLGIVIRTQTSGALLALQHLGFVLLTWNGAKTHYVAP